MMIAALAFFAISLLGIIVLFVLKAWELRTSNVLAPQMRERADLKAYEFKVLLMRAQSELRKLPPETIYFSRVVLHDAALGAAAIARFLEQQSHRLADLVSHKRGFERREPRNEFLKNVSEYKNVVEDEPSEQ